ncbi:MAG TPA: 3-ketoacyl-ACP reductase [Anaerolinea sp.]|nr:3-ketoacyl-ACP reductase [Anaerolinea sp.]
MEPKTALVTGGSRGIGRAIVLALVERGWQVLFTYRSNAEAAAHTCQAAEELSGAALAVQVDLASAEDRARLMEEVAHTLGRADLLVNNAGMAPRHRVDLLEIQEASYDEVMAANLKGAFFLTQQVARMMITQHQARPEETPVIVNIGSLSAYTSSPNRGEYALSKAGMGMMTALFADRLAGEGILVYEVRPGIVDTDMVAAAKEKYDRLIAEGLLPLRRWGKPEDVARAVVMLAEGGLPYSTGEVINVDGGFHLRRL